MDSDTYREVCSIAESLREIAECMKAHEKRVQEREERAERLRAAQSQITDAFYDGIRIANGRAEEELRKATEENKRLKDELAISR
jgi:hypothetical protein